MSIRTVVALLRGPKKRNLRTHIRVLEYALTEEGYHGLYLAGDENHCSCCLGDLVVCQEFPVGCLPGFMVACDCQREVPHAFHIIPEIKMICPNCSSVMRERDYGCWDCEDCHTTVSAGG